MITRRAKPRAAHISGSGDYDGQQPLAAEALDLPIVDEATKQAKRVGRRILGLTPETVYVGLRLAVRDRVDDSRGRAITHRGSIGTVTNVDERFCDVDWDGGGWTRFEWGKPGLNALDVAAW